MLRRAFWWHGRLAHESSREGSAQSSRCCPAPNPLFPRLLQGAMDTIGHEKSMDGACGAVWGCIWEPPVTKWRDKDKRSGRPGGLPHFLSRRNHGQDACGPVWQWNPLRNCLKCRNNLGRDAQATGFTDKMPMPPVTWNSFWESALCGGIGFTRRAGNS